MKDIKKLLTKNKLGLLGLSIFTVLLIMGTSYAIYQIVNTQTDENLVDVGCFNVSITKQENAINLENAYPISDEKGKSLTPFTFTLTNNCNVTAKYTVNLEVLKDSTMSTSFVKTLVNNGTVSKLDALPKADTKNSGSIEARTIASGILTSNSSTDYSVSLWMDENVTIEDGAMNKILKSKIVVISKALSQLTTDDAIAKSIIAQLDTTGKCPKVNADGTMQLTDAETGSGYLCSAPDNYGTSYYYRGNVTNNYVQFGKWPDDVEDVVYGFAKPTDDEPIPSYRTFSSMEECQKDSSKGNNCTLVSRKGKPMYWRIVRLNGDGSYRLVYDGTNLYENSQVSVDRQIYNSFSSDNSEDSSNNEEKLVLSLTDNSSAGYMYGDPDGVIESTKIVGKYGFSDSSTYKIAKNYTFTLSKTDDDDSTGFKLSDPIEVKGSDFSNDYVGYYTFWYSNTESDSFIYKIDSIDTSNKKIGYKVLGYGSKSKEQTQTNKNDSYFKLLLDHWYTKVLNNTKYEEYLSDTIYCNDRTISSSNFNDETITNLGYGPETTVYRWGVPIAKEIINIGINNINFTLYASNVSARLLCPAKNDSFTVSDNLYGNANLTYPVGMLTADEAVLAGAYFGKSNNNYYLYNSNGYYLMDSVIFPYSFGLSDAAIWRYGTKTALNSTDGALGYSIPVASQSIIPIINLKAGSINTGDGTKDNPYKIVEVDESPKVNVTYYLNNKLSKLEPSAYEKDRYTFQKVECDNGVTGTWNTDKWSLETSTTTTNSTCKVYFKKVESKVPEIIAQLDTTGRCPTVNEDGSVSVTAAESTNGYLCKAKDAYGDSYYYRGNVTNNYVKFAGFYWRIVRINGDNTVRIIYDGTTAHTNGESSGNRQIGTSTFNSNYNDNSNVGYMYGNKSKIKIVEGTSASGKLKYTNINSYYIAKEYEYNLTTDKFKLKDPILVKGNDVSNYIGYYTLSSFSYGSSKDMQLDYVFKILSVTVGASTTEVSVADVTNTTISKEEAQTNKNNSTIKEYLDKWYSENISNKNSKEYITDNIFCNDRSTGVSSSYFNNLAYGRNTTAYHWYASTNLINLKCPQQNDTFTVSDSTNGNGALTYPVGLLSMDEIILAGGWSSENNGYYLYTGKDWWTLSPSTYQGMNAANRYIKSSGEFSYAAVLNTYGVRPVLNLKADALKVGTGTADDPYRI